MKTGCWILSTLTALIIASPVAARAAAPVYPLSVACTIDHSKYSMVNAELRFALSRGKESVVIMGPAATLFILEVEDIGTDAPLALITVRGDMNYIRFPEAGDNFVSRREGLDGFGSKTLESKTKPINFQVVTSTGRPGLIDVDCRMEQVARPLVRTISAQDVNFFTTPN